MKRIVVLSCTSLIAFMATANYGFANNDSKWIVRARAIAVVPQEDSTVSIGGKATVDNNIIPEVDISYFFTPNIAAELIAATTQHEVNLNGSTNLGKAWLLPPTLTLQYHFTQLSFIKPYVGAGINYTHFYNATPGTLNSVQYNDSFGPALQAGVDVPIRDKWYFNVDVKKIWINTDVKFNAGAVRADVNIDPWIMGAGIGYRF